MEVTPSSTSAAGLCLYQLSKRLYAREQLGRQSMAIGRSQFARQLSVSQCNTKVYNTIIQQRILDTDLPFLTLLSMIYCGQA